jgi:hypothetical protein
MSFIGPSNGLICNHKNLKKDDDRLENLEYITVLGNAQHARANKRNWALKGDTHPNTKISYSQMVEIIALRLHRIPCDDIAAAYRIRSDYIKGLKYRVDYKKAKREARDHFVT